MKQVNNKTLLPFDCLTDYVKIVISGQSDKYIIFYGWDLSIKWSKNMFHKIRKLYTTDGAHMQNYSHGTLFGFWGIYTNAKMAFLTMELYYDSDSEKTWTTSISFSNYIFPKTD